MTTALHFARQGTSAINRRFHQAAGTVARLLVIAGVMLAGLTTIVTAQTPAQSVTGQIVIEWKKPEIILSPSELPGGSASTAYRGIQLAGNGGTGPYTFILAGKLPDGLTMSSGGLISGTPSKHGTFAFLVGVQDANKFEGSKSYSITIAKAPQVAAPPKSPTAAKITIGPGEAPGGSIGVPYTHTFYANGGKRPYTFYIIDGALPAGLTIKGGTVSGTPLQPATGPFTLVARDADKLEGEKTYFISLAGTQPSPPPDQYPPTSGLPPCPAGQVRFGANCVNDGSTTPPPPTTYSPPPTNTYPPSVPPSTTAATYPREVQTNLSRLGCLTGSVDGIWGSGSRTALQTFSYLPGAGLPGGSSEPTLAARNATGSRAAPSCGRVVTKPSPSTPPTTTPTSKARCSAIKYASTFGNSCKCSGGRIFTGTECVKPSSPTPIQGPPTSPPPNQGTPTCAVANAHYDKQRGGCVCNQGTYEKAGECVPQQFNCPANAKVRKGKCSCNKGYVEQGGQCVPQQQKTQPQPQPQPTSCTGGSYPDGSGGCRCEGSVMVYQNGKCVRPNSNSGGGGGMSFDKCKSTCLAVGIACMKQTDNDLERCKALAAQCTAKYGCPGAM